MDTQTPGAPTMVDRLALYVGEAVDVSKGSLPDAIAQGVETFIESERVPAGTLIGTKSELVGAFSVAPSTLSEATQILVSRGRVRLRQGPRGGVIVADPQPVLRMAHSLVRLTEGGGDVADAAAVRDALESAVANDALKNRTGTDVAEMRRILELLDQAESFTESYRAILDLHGAIAEACANKFLKLVYLTALHTVQTRTQKVEEEVFGRDASYLRRRRKTIHRELVEAIADRDSEALERVLRRHSPYGGH